MLTMPTYYAYLSNYTSIRPVSQPLRACTEAGAKREARRLFGDDDRGKTIQLEQSLGRGMRCHIARCTVGTPGWARL